MANKSPASKKENASLSNLIKMFNRSAQVGSEPLQLRAAISALKRIKKKPVASLSRTSINKLAKMFNRSVQLGSAISPLKNIKKPVTQKVKTKKKRILKVLKELKGKRKFK